MRGFVVMAAVGALTIGLVAAATWGRGASQETIVEEPAASEPTALATVGPSLSEEADQTAATPEQASPPRTGAERAAQTLATIRQQEEELRAQPVTPADVEHTQQLRTSLAPVAAEIGAELAEVECQGARCRAEARFRDLRHAVHSYREIVTASFEPNCARQMSFLPPGRDRRGEPVSAYLFVRCAD